MEATQYVHKEALDVGDIVEIRINQKSTLTFKCDDKYGSMAVYIKGHISQA